MGKRFKLVSDFSPAGDQPQAIKKLSGQVLSGKKHNLLLGVTGSGKTFVVANVIEKIQKPALVISPNKILAAQLYAEFKKFFPENAVEYFISYYDYYQPEAYIPQTDTYIEKDASINEHIDRLRLKSTSSLMSRGDVIVVASVSCIYNLGSPEEYVAMSLYIEKGQEKNIESVLSRLVEIYYERNDHDFKRGTFRVKGDTVDIFPSYAERAVRIEFFGDTIDSIKEVNPLTAEALSVLDKIYVYPAKHFVTSPDRIKNALMNIEAELEERAAFLENSKRLLEAQRLRQRTKYDIEMIRETGFCHGIENYSRHLADRPDGSRPMCLIDYFPKDFLTVIDESHLTIPQIRGMYEGDRARKEILVEFGFRLPSALDNRPLKFSEFEGLTDKMIYTTATPGGYELKKSCETVELIIRPTGLVDPEVEVRPAENQVNDVVREVEKIISGKKNEKFGRVIINTLTKKMSEDFTDYLCEKKINARYLHSEIMPLERIQIIKDFRQGKFDVLVGVNLLREGLDLPEVILVAVFDADKEGFLRNDKTIIQICGRAARNIDGSIILYAQAQTASMEKAMNEMERRRLKQIDYNKKHRITPMSIIKAVDELDEFEYIAKQESFRFVVGESAAEYGAKKNIPVFIKELEDEMKSAADSLNFELAAALRDKIFALKGMIVKK